MNEQVPMQINIVDLEINSPFEPEIMISNYEVAFLNAVAERLLTFFASAIFEKW
jgi:hypothetical protein